MTARLGAWLAAAGLMVAASCGAGSTVGGVAQAPPPPRSPSFDGSRLGEVVTTSSTEVHVSAARASRSLVAPRPRQPVVAVPPSDLLERIKACESGGNYQAYNRSSGASGAYQYLRSTWANYGGYSEARWAPPAAQDQRAREDLARVGTRPWYASRSCWS